MNTISIPRISDYHVHLRQGKMLKVVAPYSDAVCGRLLVMPNTDPPVTDARGVKRYRGILGETVKCDTLLTVKLTKNSTVDTIREAFWEGAIAAKLYPEGVTTNTEDGLEADVFKVHYSEEESPNVPKLLYPKRSKHLNEILNEMERLGMVLCIHGEMPGVEILHREARFLDFVNYLVYQFPELKIVLEHITTHEAVSAVRAWQYVRSKTGCRIVATITPHHLYMTLDDFIGDKIKPWNFCKPVAKQKIDLEALRHAAFSGEPWFFLGSDSAPHHKRDKECHEGCAGVFSSPVLAQSLVDLFDKHGAIDKLSNFVAYYGDAFYGQKNTSGEIKLVRKSWKVPDEIEGMKPFLAGQTLGWRLK